MLIPSISFTEFRKLKADQLRRLKCAVITFDGENLFTFINGNLEETGSIRVHSEYLGQRANTVGGETFEEVTNKELVGA